MTPEVASSVRAHESYAALPAWTVRHSLWLLGARLLPQVYLVSVSIMAARTLGADGMGRQTLIAFVCLSLVTALTGGLPLAVMRFVSERAGAGEFGRVRELVRWGWRIELFAATAGAIGLLIAAGTGATPRAAWMFAAVVVAATVLHTVPSALLNGLLRWKDATIAGLATGAGTALAIVALLAAGGGITEMFAVEALGSLVSLVWTSILARRAVRALPVGRTPGRSLIPEVPRFAGIAFVNVALAFIVWQRSEIFFLAHFSTDAAVAIYSVAFAAMTALRTAFDAAGSIVIPTVAAFKGAGTLPSMRNGYRRVVRLIVFASVPAAVGAFVLGPPLIRWVFGSELAPAGRLVMILAIGFPLVPLAHVSGALLQGLGQQRALLVSGVVAAVLSIALDVALIPRFGADGAAWANVITQLVASASVIAVAVRAINGFGLQSRSIGYLIVASVLAGIGASIGLVLVPGPFGVVLACAIFVVLFAVAQSLLRVLDPDDVNWLQKVVRQCAR